MKQTIAIFLTGLLVAFGGGFLFFQSSEPSALENDTEEIVTDEVQQEADAAVEEGGDDVSVTAEARVLEERGCLGCHSVAALDIQAGVQGADLSNVYETNESKHGKSLEELLKEPTSAVMSSVITPDPLTDDELQAIVDALKLASEQ